MNDLTLGIPDDVTERTEAYLVVVLEGRDEARLDVDVADVAMQLAKRRTGRRDSGTNFSSGRTDIRAWRRPTA